jgi:hypothetical protein
MVMGRILIAKLPFAVPAAPAFACRLKLYVPGAVGVPETTPALVKPRPGGSVPLNSEKDAGAVGFVVNVNV